MRLHAFGIDRCRDLDTYMMKTIWENARSVFFPVHAPVISGDLPLPRTGATGRCQVKHV